MQGQRGPARIVLLRQHDHPNARLGRTDPGDQGDPVHQPVLVARLNRHGGPDARHIAAQVGVHEQDVESAALGVRALHAAQRGGTTAGRGHVDIGLGGQRRGERFGEDAMVVDDQDSDANHETPFPRLLVEQGIPHRRETKR